MAIDRKNVLERLKHFVAKDILDGKDMGLDYDTPLLEWGVLNSFELTRMVAFVREELKIEIPPNKVAAQHFKDLNSLADLLVSIDTKT